eukprot:5542340-Lingulodinium_polyedra.AAC.1
MFTVEGVEAAVKKLGMKLGHANPLDSVYNLGYTRKACVAKAQPVVVMQWVANALADNILMGVEA